MISSVSEDIVSDNMLCIKAEGGYFLKTLQVWRKSKRRTDRKWMQSVKNYAILRNKYIGSRFCMDKKRIALIILYDLIASFLLGVSIVVYAVQANFAPGGVSGLAVIFNYLFSWPIGFVTVLINIPIVIATFKKLGLSFFVCSVKSVLINALFIDYIVVLLPAYDGSRLLAAVLSGVFAGVAYSMLFNIGSSTGGTDFIIAAIQRSNPKLSFGMLALIIDSMVIIASAFVFGELRAVLYGAVYTVVTSVSLDGATAVMKKLGLPTA